MGKAKDEMVKHLDRLIEEGKGLGGSRYDAPEVDLWEQRCKDALRQISDRDAGEFNMPSGGDFYMTRYEEEVQDQWTKALPLRVNVLIVAKERLERYQDKEGTTLQEIKTGWEIEAGVGPLKGKYRRETTRNRK